MILKDKVVLITGSGAGIGEAIAVAMAEAGAQVISVDIDGDAAQKTADQAGEFQVKTKAIQADVGDLDDIDQMVQTTVDDFGRLDAIVNNAGVTRRAYIMDLTEEEHRTLEQSPLSNDMFTSFKKEGSTKQKSRFSVGSHS